MLDALGEDPGAFATMSLRSEQEIEPPELLADQRWPDEDIVLAPDQHVPGDPHELAGNGNSGDIRAVPGRDPPGKGT